MLRPLHWFPWAFIGLQNYRHLMSEFGATRNQANRPRLMAKMSAQEGLWVLGLRLSYPGWWAALQPADLEMSKAAGLILGEKTCRKLHYIMSLAITVNSSPWFCVQSDEALGRASWQTNLSLWRMTWWKATQGRAAIRIIGDSLFVFHKFPTLSAHAV